MNPTSVRMDNAANGSGLRIVVHDYGGYPFIVQLSRALAARGHEVMHLFAAGFRKPKGPVARHPDDPSTLTLQPVSLMEPLRRGGIRRLAQERRYGRLLAEQIGSHGPHVVVSANSPLLVQSAAVAGAHGSGAASVFWIQDLHSIAITRITARRWGVVGRLVGAPFGRLERSLLRKSEGIVATSAAYLPVLAEWGIPRERTVVIENWAPVVAAPPPKVNPWSVEHALSDRLVVMYAGTLALKHNPRLLLELARALPGADVVVVSEGPGADWLRRHSVPENLRVLPFQPYDRVPEMLATADLLVAVLEHDASSFSAPSKVLTYLATGRPVLAAMPRGNASARAIEEAGAGWTVDPAQPEELIAVAREALADRERLQAVGDAGLAYARSTFNIESITDRFEEILSLAVGRKVHSRPPAPVDTLGETDTTHGMRS